MKNLRCLPYLEINKIASHSLIDAGGRHKTLGSETKDFIAHSITSSMGVEFVLVPLVLPSPLEAIWVGPNECCIIGGHVLQLWNTELRKSISFTALSSKPTCSLSLMP